MANHSFKSLSREDMPGLEPELCAYLKDFLAFSDGRLYFPEDGGLEAILLASEKRLLLPLALAGKDLGMLLLEGIKPAEARRLMPFLPKIAAAGLATLACSKAASQDDQTGLYTEAYLFEHMENEARGIHAHFSDPGRAGRGASPYYRICLGMVVIGWHNWRNVARDAGYETCAAAFAKMGATLGKILPANVVGAPLGKYEGRYEFGLLFPAVGREACQKLANDAKRRLESLDFTDKATGRKFQARLHAGHAIYPQDMAGEEMALPIVEQAMRLRDRSRLACRFARISSAAKDGIMAFGQILREGGIVLENMTGRLARVNLGLAANASEGMSFGIIDRESGKSKGALVLLETRPKDSLAEIFYLDDAAFPPEPGDQLILRKAGQWRNHANEDAGNATASDDGSITFAGHSQFLGAFASACAKKRRFALGISRFEPVGETVNVDIFLELLQGTLSDESLAPQPAMAGRYGSNGVAFYHPDLGATEVAQFYHSLAGLARDNGLLACSGIFTFPFLNYSRNDAEACALKGLEYGALLPEPHIGFCDSLALNISADKRYSLGDMLGAMDEYRLALVADPANAMARNSLGVCLAGLGKLSEAREMFCQAFEDSGENSLKAKIAYNLGTLFQKEQDGKNARGYYRKCLKLDPGYVFAWLKLGQLHEREGKNGGAAKLYARALELAGNDSEVAGMAERYLARLEVAAKKTEKARELLHDALLRNPEDAASMAMLAGLYLEDGGDPAVAEMLARGSVNINGSPEAWDILATALERQGKATEAALARARVGKSGGQD